jgi:hypothetical protein
MGLDTIPTRSNSVAIDQTWYNIIRSALLENHVPRNASGVVTDEAGSIGSAAYRWLNAHLLSSYLYNAAGEAIRLLPPSSIPSDYTLTLPPALPASGDKLFMASSAGVSSIALAPDNASLEVSGTLLQVKDGGITRTKQAPLNKTLSSSSGAWSLTGTNTGAYVPITNLSATITTTGRPVWVGLVSDGSGNGSYRDGGSLMRFKRDATQIGVFFHQAGVGPVSSLQKVDFEATTPGTYTYSVELRNLNTTYYMYYAKLLVFEM